MTLLKRRRERNNNRKDFAVLAIHHSASVQIDPLRGLVLTLTPKALPLLLKTAIQDQQIKVGSGINGLRPTAWVPTIYSVPLCDFLVLNCLDQ
jgi:hypothetical protein